MQLKEFSLISPSVEASEVFQAIQTVIAPEAIDQALEKSNSFEQRKRKLPASLVVCLVIAMSLWSSDSMATVLQNLVNGLNRQWMEQYWMCQIVKLMPKCLDIQEVEKGQEQLSPKSE